VYNVVGTSRSDFDHMDLVKQLEEKRQSWTPPPAPPATPSTPEEPKSP
jgi:hypothetical protein